MRCRYDAHRTSHTLVSLTNICHQGFKQDEETQVEVEVDLEAPKKDTFTYRKDISTWYQVPPIDYPNMDWEFGVAYVSVGNSDEAKKVKEVLKDHSYVLLIPPAVYGPY